MSNFLDSDLIDPHYLVRRGSKHREPLKVDESFSEAFSFKGDPTGCSFLCSFAIISRGLRLVFRCWNKYDGAIYFGIGLTPVDVSTDNTLDSELFIPQFEISRTPDVWITNGWSVDPVELFVTQGNLLIGGHIFSCVVETVNCLSVPLNNRNGWCRNSEAKNVLPMQILPLHRERFFMSDEIILEAMFSYEIISTDLALVIALKVGCGGKSFAAAFMPFPVVTGKKQVEELLDENQWKTHDYKKYSKAFEKMTLIAIRNIRAGILMTEEDKSVLKIRIFAV
ncbi:unnamed protein product [Allacma fusca]|uniref:Uncharacterized protein n=1 Tax=Allacma fusca TaxID=39272 RepID=A0A8J2L7T2_9HEXA|nr:unnamed protein product [Allacma fusca]